MIRIYGSFNSEASYSRVSRGFASVFPDAHLFDLGSWGNDLDDGAEEQPGATDEVGVFVGNLAELDAAFRAAHERLYVMVAPNSNTVGKALRKTLADVEYLLAPSGWAVGVLRTEFPKKQILCVPHGIDAGFQPKTLYRGEDFRVLHLSSSVLERKGTDKLLEGWALAKIPGELFLSVPTGSTYIFQELVEELGIEQSVHITDRLNLTVEKMADLYSTMDYVCQPSRGEGFGLVPLEARACGTPVIATNCTGHSEHAYGPGVVLVQTGDDAAIDDFPGAYAPSLSAKAVADALIRGYNNRLLYSADAKRVSGEIRKRWSWENQLKEFKNVVS